MIFLNSIVTWFSSCCQNFFLLGEFSPVIRMNFLLLRCFCHKENFLLLREFSLVRGTLFTQWLAMLTHNLILLWSFFKVACHPNAGAKKNEQDQVHIFQDIFQKLLNTFIHSIHLHFLFHNLYKLFRVLAICISNIFHV